MATSALTADADLDLDFDLTVGQLEADIPEFTAAVVTQASVQEPATCERIYCCC